MHWMEHPPGKFLSMDSSASKKRIRIALIARWLSFPHGMAMTQRVRLISQALAESGAEVTVFCVGAPERPLGAKNNQASGHWNGIEFSYPTGTTIRPHSFLKRRLVDLKGLLRMLRQLITMMVNKELSSIYFWNTTQSMTIFAMALLALAKLGRVPLVLEINERPWTMREDFTLARRLFSPLTGARGVVVISDFLKKWSESEAMRRGQILHTFLLPILVDMDEVRPSGLPAPCPCVTFSGSPGYSQTIMFILDAMEWVWSRHPTWRLTITGCEPNDPASAWLLKEIENRSLRGHVHIPGYLPRAQLLQLLASSSALLIPLFDDVRSRARFPTKIGEYLASGRPIVTNSVGEITSYLKGGLNAFICGPGDPQAFGCKIIEALEDEGRAYRVGLLGRNVADEHFNYKRYVSAIDLFFRSLNYPVK